jgi:hypothetical protein
MISSLPIDAAAYNLLEPLRGLLLIPILILVLILILILICLVSKG